MKEVLSTILFFLYFSTFPFASFAGISGYDAAVPSGKPGQEVRQPGYVQKGAFKNRRYAEKLSDKLKRAGYKVYIVSVIHAQKKFYRVLAGKTRKQDVAAAGFHGSKWAAGTKTTGTLMNGLPRGAFRLSDSGGNGVPGTTPQEKGPVGTLRTYRELFGYRGTYFHPYLTVSETYTDNAFSTKDNKKANLSTILSPGLWISLPRSRQMHLSIDTTSNRVPGGQSLTMPRPEVIRRYQANLLYGAVIPLPSANSPYGNSVSHTGYGDFEFNGNKFSAKISDLFLKSFDTRGLNISTQPGRIDRYYNNLVFASAGIDTGNRFSVRIDYSNFLVHYSDLSNSFMNRTDNTLAGYLFYRFQPKTSFFLEYSHVGISYADDSGLNSSEHHFMAGVQWEITAKSAGTVKAGYGIKDFAGSSQNEGTFVAEAAIRHQLTPKTILTFTGSRTTNETNVESSLYTITNQAGVGYQQILTSKITGLIDFLYINERYKGGVTADTNTTNLEDNVYQASIGLQYEFQRWLKSSIGYIYTRRNSSDSYYDFEGNTVSFRVAISL